MTAAESANGTGNAQVELTSVVDRYLDATLRLYPLDREALSLRTERFRNDMLHFLEAKLSDSSGPQTDADLLDLLRAEFGEELAFRNTLMRQDALLGRPDPQHRHTLLLSVVVTAVVALLLKGVHLYATWTAPAIAASIAGAGSMLPALLMPFCGILGYIAGIQRRANHHRILPYALLSTIAFTIAMSVSVSISILERKPVPRYHLLMVASVPVVDSAWEPSIYRLTLDLDRTGLPSVYTRSRSLAVTREDSSFGAVQVYWMLFCGILLGNYYVLRLMADRRDEIDAVTET